MRKKVTAGVLIVIALALVIAVGMYSSDYFLKATDGEENLLTEMPEGSEVFMEEEFEEVVADAPVESTEETTEVTDEETTEEVAEETTEVEEVEKSVVITSSVDADSQIAFGDEITLTATLTGYENTAYTIQWQMSLDEVNWIDVEGANAETYTFVISEETSGYSWRAVVNE